jgi:hypothetical protein
MGEMVVQASGNTKTIKAQNPANKLPFSEKGKEGARPQIT